MSCSVSGEHLVIAAHVLLAGELALENRRAAGSATLRGARAHPNPPDGDHPDHLYWPDLDIDLSLESIRHPENFPLISRG
jgi:hypothetical protein